MSVSALQINEALRKIDGDIRKFVRTFDKAKIETSAKKRREILEELRLLKNKLSDHRDQVRKLTTQAGAQRVKKDKLADARQRIESEMRRFGDFEKSVSAQQEQACESVSEPGSNADEDNRAEVKVSVDHLVDENKKNELVEEFKCKVCLVHLVGCEPTLTRCSHLFCGDCMEQWFKANPGNKTWAQRAKTGASVPCPVCKEPLLKDQDLHPVRPDGDGGSRVLYQLLCDTKITCENHPKCNPNGKCDWVGTYGSYQEHIRLCQNAPIFGCADWTPEIPNLMNDVVESTASGADPESLLVEEHLSANETDSAANEDPEGSSACNDLHLTGLIDELLQIKTDAPPQGQHLDIDDEDTCSTQDSEQAEASDNTPFQAPESDSASESDADNVDSSLEEDPSDNCWPQVAIEKPLKKSQTKSDEVQDAVTSQQWQALQWQYQAAQYQAAQYQAAQYQAARWQMAQFQAAHVSPWQQAMQTQMAQAAYAAQVGQMQAHKAMEMQKAHTAKQRCR